MVIALLIRPVLPDSEVTFTNAWALSDEDLYSQA